MRVARLFIGSIFFVIAAALSFSQSAVRTSQPAEPSPAGNELLSVTVRGNSVYTFTALALYRRDKTAGDDWRIVYSAPGLFSRIVAVNFTDASRGMVVAAAPDGVMTLASTADGGAAWSLRAARLPSIDSDVDLSLADLDAAADGSLSLSFRVETSSNFIGRMTYRSSDGRNWRAGERDIRLADGRADDRLSSDGWRIETDGECFAAKSSCVQTTKLVDPNGVDATPAELRRDGLAVEHTVAARSTLNAGALSPGGSTRISLNRGFDMCNAPTASQMQAWWSNSPLYDMNIYMSGRNRACSAQPNLSAAWVDQVTQMGWGLIPTVVGYQSPCTASATTAKFSYDPAVAETQGRGEADIAAADAANLGITTGSILYYDLERYDPPTPDTSGCRPASIAFIKGWTDRIKELGFRSGVYGSPKNAQEDWVTLPSASKMDVVWLARWDNVASVWTYVSFPSFPTAEWADHQRIKQWQAPHNETWGGVTFNIDGDISDAPVAGVPVRHHPVADFDGDGRTDVSVFRPDQGIWFILNSRDFTLSAIGFGISTDVIAPGDLDGDGRADVAVFRPADGYWHMLTKANTYATRQFGQAGDIPVAADYNGDGKTDLAVWRPSNGVWYIANSDSRGTFTFVQFGQAGDKPVPADYDGDGKTDLAVWRPSDGIWYIYRSSDQTFVGIGFGLAGDVPAQGDYDGDGKADEAVFRDGVWYLLRSTEGFGAVSFGLAGDIPTTGDYDGDGRDDIAVYRPSQGAWFILRSTAGFAAYGFGYPTDRPVPAAYLPN